MDVFAELQNLVTNIVFLLLLGGLLAAMASLTAHVGYGPLHGWSHRYSGWVHLGLVTLSVLALAGSGWAFVWGNWAVAYNATLFLPSEDILPQIVIYAGGSGIVLATGFGGLSWYSFKTS
jgi:hypothetical protein